MSGELFDYIDEPDAFMREHYLDPRDDAEALTILLEERIAEKAAECEVCHIVGRPCLCDEDDAFHDTRRVLYRGDGSRTRR